MPYCTPYTVLGLDLGQSADPTAAAVLQRTECDSDYVGPRDPRLQCRGLKRYPLGTSYVDIVNDVLDTPIPVDVIAVDFGGPGQGVVDFLRQAANARGWRGRIVPIQFTGGNVRPAKRTRGSGVSYYTVPKMEIITSLILLQQQKMIEFVDSDETERLMRELQVFQQNFTLRGRPTQKMGAMPVAGAHDDLVCAMALACWFMGRFGYRQLSVYQPGGERETIPMRPTPEQRNAYIAPRGMGGG